MQTHTSPLRRYFILIALVALLGYLPTVSAQRGTTNSSPTTTGRQATASQTGTSATGTGTSATGTSTDTTTPPGRPIASITAPAISISGSGIVAPSFTSALPTIAGAYKIIPPSVPPSANAPYLRTSQLPEGTFFIATGSALGFLGLSVILWRAMVAWSLHRSVKRAQQKQTLLDAKAMVGPPGGGFYAAYAQPSHSFEHLVNQGRGLKQQSHAARSSLFFSPTSGAGLNSQPALNNSSGFLPSGYYPAGTQSPAHSSFAAQSQPNLPLNTPSHLNFPSNHRMSSGAQPQSYSPQRDASSSRDGHSSRDGARPARNSQGRAPSAFLGDLLDSSGPIGPSQTWR